MRRSMLLIKRMRVRSPRTERIQIVRHDRSVVSAVIVVSVVRDVIVMIVMSAVIVVSVVMIVFPVSVTRAVATR